MLTTVPLSAIEDAWHELYDTTEERAQELFSEFVREQPDAAAYLACAEEEINVLDDRGFLMLYGVWAWLACKLNGHDGTRITATALAAAAERNHADMMRMQEDRSRQVMDASAQFRADFRQLPLLGAILHDVMEGQMESQSRQDDITGMIVLCVKSLLDCLDGT